MGKSTKIVCPKISENSNKEDSGANVDQFKNMKPKLSYIFLGIKM